MYVDPKVVVSLSAVNVKENKLIERKKVDAPNNWFVDVEGAGPLHIPTIEAILDKYAVMSLQALYAQNFADLHLIPTPSPPSGLSANQ